MYKFIVDDETTQKVKQATSNSKSILEKFEEIDEKYTPKTNQDVNLEKMEYTKPTQEEVNQKATDSLIGYKNSNIESINEEFEQKNKDLNNELKEVQTSKENQKQEIENTYQKVKDNAQNDAIKRGLARSSIIVNKLANYDQGMLNELNELSTSANEKIESLKTQLNNIESEKLSALNSFDIEYAIKLQEKIDSLNSDITKKEQEVIKYNNQIEELKNDIQNQNFEDTLKFYQYVNENGTYVIDNIKNKEKYELAKDYFLSMNKEDALNELTNNSVYRKNIGEANYQKLLEEIQK